MWRLFSLSFPMQEFWRTDMTQCIKKTLEQVLKEEGELFTVASGISMLPCIRAKKDVLHLVRPTEPLQVHDVILYRRKNSGQILHRILDIRDSGYVLCGDNQSSLEFGIQDSQILGVLRGFYHGKRYIDCQNNQGYKIYIKIWCHSIRLRKPLLLLMNLGRRGWKIVTWKRKN